MSRARRVWIWVLIVAASLIGLASILTAWVDRQMLDEQAWRTASAELIEDPQVRDALSRLPGQRALRRRGRGGRAGGAAARRSQGPRRAARGGAAAARDGRGRASARGAARPGAVRSTRARSLSRSWSTSSRTRPAPGSRPATVPSPSISASSSPQVGAEVGLPASALDRLPPDAGTITVMRSDQLAAAQTAVRALESAQRRAARGGPRPLRAGHLSRQGRAARGDPQCRLGVRAGRARGARGAAVRRRGRGRCARRARQPGHRSPRLADQQLDPRPDRLGGDPVRRHRPARRGLRRADRGRDLRAPPARRVS